jgi:hypothetical protein
LSLLDILNAFNKDVTQCDSLIVNAHRLDPAGSPLFPAIDQRQITIAAFLNLYVAWETFLESSLAEFMTGGTTISGKSPTRYVIPPSPEAAKKLVIGIQRFFDYGNHNHMLKMVGMWFKDGYPYEPHLSSIDSTLADLRTMRNASAHISSTTQTALESLATRVLGVPVPNIDLYSFLLRNDPRSGTGETVYLSAKNLLLVTAELIAQG